MAAYLSGLFGKYMASGKDEISILIIGKPGIGKSALVNGIMGRKVAREETSVLAVTTRIKSYECTFHIREIGRNVVVKMWDTPGLCSAFRSDEEEDRLKTELAKHFKEMYHVFYCLDMRNRLEKSDLEELEAFSKKAGPDLWKHTTFVFTFANQVLPTDPAVDELEHFQKIMSTWIDALHKALTKHLNISADIVKDIPIVPTGHGNDPPPDRKDWVTPLWKTAMKWMTPEAQPTMYAIKFKTTNKLD